MHLSHRCAAVLLQLTIKIIPEKNISSVVDPTTNDVDICSNVCVAREGEGVGHVLSGIYTSETFQIILCQQH